MAREHGSVGGSKSQREPRPFVRYLTAGALLITLAVVGLLWHRISEQGRELAGMQQALAGERSARAAAELPPPVVFIPGRVPAPSREGGEEGTFHEAGGTEQVFEEEVELTAEERAAQQQARFDHTQGIFEAQVAADYDGERVRRLEAALEPHLLSLRSTETSLQLGRLECRGRMCGLDVSFERLSDGMAGIERLTRAAESLPDRTLVHVVPRPGRTPNDNVGRIFFEWQPVDAQ